MTLLESFWDLDVSNLVLVLSTLLVGYLLYLILKPFNRIRRIGDVGLFFGTPEPSGILRERQIERMRIRRQVGELPPVFPNGWYNIAESHSIGKGKLTSVTVVGKQLLLVRSTSGEVFVTDTYCPHLGANLSVGGTVVRDNCVQCPFHGWIFNAETGRCVDIPYHEGRIPDQAVVDTWRCREVNKSIYLWYHAEGLEPEWEIPEISEVTNGRWKYGGRTEHEVMCHIQEIPENGGDIAHLNYLHRSAPSPIEGSDITRTNLSILKPAVQHVWDGRWEARSEEEKHVGVMHLNQYMTFWGFRVPFTDSKLIAEQHGPGIVHMHFDFGRWGTAIVFQTVTPEEPLLQRVRFRFYSNMPAVLMPFVKFFLTVEAQQFERDIYIWSNKTYRRQPVLVPSDFLIKKHRRWFSQFYTENSPTLARNGQLSTSSPNLDW